MTRSTAMHVRYRAAATYANDAGGVSEVSFAFVTYGDPPDVAAARELPSVVDNAAPDPRIRILEIERI